MFVGDPFTAAWLVIAENARGKGCSGSHVLSSSSGLSVYDSPVVLLRQSGSRPHLEPGAGASRRTSSMASSGEHQDSGRNSSATDHTDDGRSAASVDRLFGTQPFQKLELRVREVHVSFLTTFDPAGLRQACFS